MARKTQKTQKPKTRYKDLVKIELGDGKYVKITAQRLLTGSELYSLSNIVEEQARRQYSRDMTR